MTLFISGDTALHFGVGALHRNCTENKNEIVDVIIILIQHGAKLEIVVSILEV